MTPTSRGQKAAKKSKTIRAAKKSAPARTAGKARSPAARPARPSDAPKTAKAAKAAKAAKSVKPAPVKLVRIPRSKLRYKKNQEIVYPLQGVGKVVSIEERPFRATRLLYYIIYLEVSDMTVMVPVERADELGIRPIVDKREAQKALRLLIDEVSLSLDKDKDEVERMVFERLESSRGK